MSNKKEMTNFRQFFPGSEYYFAYKRIGKKEYEIIEEIDVSYLDDFKEKYLFQKQYIDLNCDAWKSQIDYALDCCGWIKKDQKPTELQILEAVYRYMGGDPCGYGDGSISGNNRKEVLRDIQAL